MSDITIARAPSLEADPAALNAELASIGLSHPSLVYLVTKRFVDLAAALFGIILCLPLWALIAIAIKLDSPGPVFFRQRRPGFRGKPFWIIKFRTMCCDAEQRLDEVMHLNRQPDGSLIRIPNDPRVTRVGRFLRRTSLDETPQLINVLKGEMSLVGPRPISRPIPDPRGRIRLEAMPGITGLWQVNGRKDTDTNYMLEKDMEYLRRRSLTLDLLILLKTFAAVVRANGAE